MASNTQSSSVIPTSVDGDARTQEVLLKAVARAFAHWGLTNQESADLFNTPIATWNRMKAGKFRGRLGQDKTVRACLVVEICQRSATILKSPFDQNWLRNANSNALFEGKAPLAFMLEGGIPSMEETRDYLNAVAHGP